MAWLTETRKSLITGVFTSVFTGALAVIAAVWLIASVAVGSVVIAQWIGGR